MESISIIVSNYNNSKYVGQAIDSVLRQSCPDWELVIIDDCSSDNSEEIIKKYLADCRIRFFQNDRNIGCIGTLRKLFSLSANDILLVLDSDDTLEPGAVENVSSIFENNPDVGYVYSQCNYCDQFLKPYKIGSKKIAGDKTNINDNSIVALRAFRKKVFEKTGGFDENCLYAEDYDLSLKLEEVTKVFFIGKVLYNYRVLKKSQTHGFRNEMINRSSQALARLNAYQRRLGSGIPNLDKPELLEAMIWGILTATLCGRIKLIKKFFFVLARHGYVLFCPCLYVLIIKKIIKIARFKNNKI